MDSLGDHSRGRSSRNRSSRRRSRRDTARTLRLANRLLLLTGALMFANGITITLITSLIPVAISSAVVASFAITALVGAYTFGRSPRRGSLLRALTRPLASMLRSRTRSPRRQGGL